jgi:hypothetical protein
MKNYISKYLIEQYDKQDKVDDFVKFAAHHLDLETPSVIGHNLVPVPPARIMPFMPTSFQRL